MLQYITTLIDKYIYKPSPNEIHDKFYCIENILIDKRTYDGCYNWRGDDCCVIVRNIIHHNSSDGRWKSLGILLPVTIRNKMTFK